MRAGITPDDPRPGSPLYEYIKSSESTTACPVLILNDHAGALARHFEHIGLSPGLLVTEWWLTIFSRRFTLDVVGRLWDCFLLEGEPLLVRAAVCVCAHLEAQLAGQPLEVCLEVVNKTVVTQDAFFQALGGIKSSVKYIRQLLESET